MAKKYFHVAGSNIKDAKLRAKTSRLFKSGKLKISTIRRSKSRPKIDPEGFKSFLVEIK